MGWFDEQLKVRKEHDEDVFADAFANMASSVLGTNIPLSIHNDRVLSQDAMLQVLKFYHVKAREIPTGMDDFNEQLEFLLRPSGIMHRTVHLEEGWQHDAVGAMLGTMKETGEPVALLPGKLYGYTYYDSARDRCIPITKKNADLFEMDAIAFYKPFPLKKLTVKDLLIFTLQNLSSADIFAVLVSYAVVTLMGFIPINVTSQLYGSVIETKSMQMLLSIGVFLICTNVSQALLSVARSLVMQRLQTKADIAIDAASMMRIMSLPPTFFKDYSSGELTSYLGQLQNLCNTLMNAVFTTGLTSIFSLVYIGSIFKYAPTLVVPALIIIFVNIGFSLITTFMQMGISKKSMELGAKESGMTYSMVSGIQKIKLAGAEKRAFARWADMFSKVSRLTYNPPMFLKINSVISTAISLAGTIVMYYMAIQSHVTISEYSAFNVAYGMVSGAFSSLAAIATMAATVKPTLDMAKPIMDCEPEVSEGKQVIDKLSGGIEVSNVSFRYTEDSPNVLENFSLKIKPGQYVAIVGKTGCGKSTLMRLLLGFEKPQRGSIYYDGRDMDTIDLKSLRRKIGSVMQTGGLFQGDIYSNIVISAPWLTLEDAWEAAELAGMKDDIENMPMGMFTLISEGQGGISGGQRQRLMIARAIAPKPKILMFDEATSALDNITQKKVAESLDTLKCTRLVIAHRLSTIKNCDRIIVMDKGAIIEDGTYEELIAANGYFAELVERQRLDK